MSISANGHTRRQAFGGVSPLVQGHVGGKEQSRNLSSAPGPLGAAASPGNSAPRSSILSLRPLHTYQRLIGCQVEFVDVISWAPHWTLYGSYCPPSLKQAQRGHRTFPGYPARTPARPCLPNRAFLSIPCPDTWSRVHSGASRSRLVPNQTAPRHSTTSLPLRSYPILEMWPPRKCLDMAVLLSWALGRRCRGKVWVRFLKVPQEDKEK